MTHIASIFFIFGIIFTTILGGRGAPLPPPERILSTSTVPLENLSLNPGDFIILADQTPIPIEAAHVSMNVPCQLRNNTTNNGTMLHTDIGIIAGVEPDLKSAIPEFITKLSHPENNKCTYHVQLPQVRDQHITSIAIINNGNQTIKFTSGNFATISISTGGPLI
jgi:hypothetical protein